MSKGYFEVKMKFNYLGEDETSLKVETKAMNVNQIDLALALAELIVKTDNSFPENWFMDTFIERLNELMCDDE